MNTHELNTISDQIKKRNVVAFIGAGVSATYTDARSGKVYNGLPLAGQIVKNLAKQKSYISDTMSLEEACFIYKRKESPAELRKFLEDQINNKNICPLPAHNLIAKLPFNAYISMNFDTLLEKALASYNKTFKVIINDEDVPLLRQFEIPVIKPHGCISKPNSLVVAQDEVEPFLQKSPIIDAYLKTILANKTVLFLGFSLNDPDFKILYQQIKHALGDMMPKSYAITISFSEFQQLYWQEHKVQLLKLDLTHFLNELQLLYNSDDAGDINILKDERINIQNFEDIINLRNLPSEVQIIDSFLDKLLIDIQNFGLDIDTITFNFKEASNIIIKKRQSFNDFKKIVENILLLLQNPERIEIENELEEIKKKRSELSEKFKAKGKTLLIEGDKILLLSQSSRVIELLRGVPKRIQEKCEIFIAECRTKSIDFSSFQDALSLLEKLKDTHYKFNFIPDTVMGHILSNKKVNKVFLGANTIFTNDKGEFNKFLNTSGSLIISNFCLQYSIPLFVVAETAKQKSETLIDNDIFKDSHEIREIKSSNQTLVDLIAEGKNINVLNITYDLVDRHAYTHYITEL